MGRFWLVVMVLVHFFVSATAVAQERVKPPLNAAAPEADALPARQTGDGQALLQKIMKVAHDIPLMDVPAVFEVFGFRQAQYLPALENARDVMAIPALHADEALASRGFDVLSVHPWKTSSRSTGRVLASLDGEINATDFCITQAHVEKAAERFAGRVSSTGQSDSPHSEKVLNIAFARMPVGGVQGLATFVYGQQPCAEKFKVVYLREDGTAFQAAARAPDVLQAN